VSVVLFYLLIIVSYLRSRARTINQL